MMNRCANRKSVCLILSLALLLNIFLAFPQYAYAGTNTESLITNLSNSGNAKLTFNLSVPAKTTCSYSIKFAPNNKNKALETLTGSVKNTTNKKKTFTVTKQVRYYSSKYSYKVSASYNYRKKNYTDTDAVKSLIPSKTFYSNKFVWTDSAIKKYKANKWVEIGMSFTAGVALDILVSKGYATKTLVAAYTIGGVASDLVAASATSDIRSTAKKGWGYRIKVVPNKSRTSYATYLLTYNSKGKLADTEFVGNISMSPYCKSIK